MEWLDGWMDVWLVGRLDGWMDVGWLVGWMDGWMNVWLDGWQDGWLVGWFVVWVNGSELFVNQQYDCIALFVADLICWLLFPHVVCIHPKVLGVNMISGSVPPIVCRPSFCGFSSR